MQTRSTPIKPAKRPNDHEDSISDLELSSSDSQSEEPAVRQTRNSKFKSSTEKHTAEVARATRRGNKPANARASGSPSSLSSLCVSSISGDQTPFKPDSGPVLRTRRSAMKKDVKKTLSSLDGGDSTQEEKTAPFARATRSTTQRAQTEKKRSGGRKSRRRGAGTEPGDDSSTEKTVKYSRTRSGCRRPTTRLSAGKDGSSGEQTTVELVKSFAPQSRLRSVRKLSSEKSKPEEQSKPTAKAMPKSSKKKKTSPIARKTPPVSSKRGPGRPPGKVSSKSVMPVSSRRLSSPERARSESFERGDHSEERTPSPEVRPPTPRNGLYKVKRIVGLKYGKDNTPELLVHWEGYGHSENTWEPLSSLHCAALDIGKFLKTIGKKLEIDGDHFNIVASVAAAWSVSSAGSVGKGPSLTVSLETEVMPLRAKLNTPDVGSASTDDAVDSLPSTSAVVVEAAADCGPSSDLDVDRHVVSAERICTTPLPSVVDEVLPAKSPGLKALSPAPSDCAELAIRVEEAIEEPIQESMVVEEIATSSDVLGPVPGYSSPVRTESPTVQAAEPISAASSPPICPRLSASPKRRTVSPFAAADDGKAVQDVPPVGFSPNLRCSPEVPVVPPNSMVVEDSRMSPSWKAHSSIARAASIPLGNVLTEPGIALASSQSVEVVAAGPVVDRSPRVSPDSLGKALLESPSPSGTGISTSVAISPNLPSCSSEFSLSSVSGAASMGSPPATEVAQLLGKQTGKGDTTVRVNLKKLTACVSVTGVRGDDVAPVVQAVPSTSQSVATAAIDLEYDVSSSDDSDNTDGDQTAKVWNTIQQELDKNDPGMRIQPKRTPLPRAASTPVTRYDIKSHVHAPNANQAAPEAWIYNVMVHAGPTDRGHYESLNFGQCRETCRAALRIYLQAHMGQLEQQVAEWEAEAKQEEKERVGIHQAVDLMARLCRDDEGFEVVQQIITKRGPEQEALLGDKKMRAILQRVLNGNGAET